jgi:pyruvate/2-oxoglutarate/acetoin dehydrogenase E1 component/TPP-dependent pyruvate/acetoin dehydrogenase alpha subunit
MSEEMIIMDKDLLVKDNGISSVFKKEVLQDYFIANLSRQASLLGRKEVLTGKAKFGILGDGKELAQIAMAKSFQKGDWRSGYYRDQTFMMALGLCSVEQYFSQLYADCENDPFSGGRQMNSHYATPTIDEEGNWLNHTELYNISADISSTGGQMARALGIGLASKYYREVKVDGSDSLSHKGNEISFCTIGDSSTSEGVFWETMNAAAVIKVPLLVAVWDDGYGISVPKELQTVKASISNALKGFEIDKNKDGIYIFTAKGWDYQEMCEVFAKASELVRTQHISAMVHIEELTQPQGHSTSGSHERYKSKERLEWEKEMDCIVKFKEWIIQNEIASAEELEATEQNAINLVKEGKNKAWNTYSEKVKSEKDQLEGIVGKMKEDIPGAGLDELKRELSGLINPTYGEVVKIARQLSFYARKYQKSYSELNAFIEKAYDLATERYHAHLYADGDKSALNVPVVPAKYEEDAPKLNGYQILNKCFESALSKRPEILAFGEDVGKIGDVNQGFAGLQEIFGESRIFDCGIREWTIMGQAIGAALRGLRPIAEIQYLDYLAYAFSALSDDLATLRYRSNGIQKAPAIIRTRGHRLEGIWHAGSPMGMLLNSLRGIYICVPRNMTQAAGMYNTLLQADDPGLVIECLNGYRLKEALPSNIGEFTVPLGVPEVLQAGTDITLVSYGSCVREAQKAVHMLSQFSINVELIDIQTLLPFDTEGIIVNSLKKTNRILFVDEDVPGGATAFMMQQVLEVQGGYKYLDSAPVTLTAHEHRTPFGSDGDYFTKPGPEDIFDAVYKVMKEVKPQQYF